MSFCRIIFVMRGRQSYICVGLSVCQQKYLLFLLIISTLRKKFRAHIYKWIETYLKWLPLVINIRKHKNDQNSGNYKDIEMKRSVVKAMSHSQHIFRAKTNYTRSLACKALVSTFLKGMLDLCNRYSPQVFNSRYNLQKLHVCTLNFRTPSVSIVPVYILQLSVHSVTLR